MTTDRISPKIALRLIALSAVLAFAVAAGAKPARATYPGSRDGRLAFGMTISGNTDIYTLLPNGNDLERLTNAPSFDSCPSYSADGKEIAYCSGTLGGPGGGIEIWKMRQDGRKKEQVTHTGGFLTFPDFSPDGDQIAFAGTMPTAINPGRPHLFVIGSDGEGLVQLTTGTESDQYPVWSPGGEKLAFIRNRQVWTIDSNGANATQLTFDAAPKGQLPDWSPDGREIAYQSGTDIWAMNADGSGQHPVYMDASRIQFGAAWSPTGKQIAFVSFAGNPATRTIYIVNADGAGVHALHPGPGPQLVPSWQPGSHRDGEGED